MIKVVIAEDDFFFLTFLESKLMELGGYEIIGVSDSVIGAYNIIRSKEPMDVRKVDCPPKYWTVFSLDIK